MKRGQFKDLSQVCGLEAVRAELLGAPAVVDHGHDRVRLPPVVDVLAVVGDDVAVARPIRHPETSVEELEPVTPTGCARDDLDFLAVEVTVTEHGDTSLSESEHLARVCAGQHSMNFKLL